MTSTLIPLTDAALRAARPDWQWSGWAWATDPLIRTGRLGCVRVGRRIYVTPELMEQFIAAHTEARL